LKSGISAGTWTIPKKGRTDVMPHLVYNYRALSENTIKDNTPCRAKIKSSIELQGPNSMAISISLMPIIRCRRGLENGFLRPPSACTNGWQGPRTVQCTSYLAEIHELALQDCIGMICYVYGDDIVFLNSLEEQYQNI